MNRRGFLSLLTRASAAAPFAAAIPRWYGTAAQWALHSREGVMRLARAGRLVEVPPSALQHYRSDFVNWSSQAPGFVTHTGWLGYWSGDNGRILAWVDLAGRAWWAKP